MPAFGVLYSRKSDCGLPEIRIKAPSIERSGQQQQQLPQPPPQPSHTPHHHHQAHHQQQASIGSGSLSKHWSYEHVDRYWPRPSTHTHSQTHTDTHPTKEPVASTRRAVAVDVVAVVTVLIINVVLSLIEYSSHGQHSHRNSLHLFTYL